MSEFRPHYPILQVYYLTTQIMNRVLRIAQCSITREEFIILREIFLQTGMNQTQLAGRMGKDRNNLSRTCSEMERKALITRSSSPEDQRNYVLALTEYGRKVYLRADKALEFYREHIRKAHTPEEYEIFKKVLAANYDVLMKLKKYTDDALLPDASLRTPISGDSHTQAN